MYPGFYRQELTLWFQDGTDFQGAAKFPDGEQFVVGRFQRSFVVIGDGFGGTGVRRDIGWIDVSQLVTLQQTITPTFINSQGVYVGENTTGIIYLTEGHVTGNPLQIAKEVTEVETLPDVNGVMRVWRLNT